MTDMEEYLAGLRAGDVVVVSHKLDGYREWPVTKATKTQVIIGDTKFRRANGWEMGPEWGRKSNIEYPTKKVARIAAFRTIRDTLKKDLTLESIPAMRLALDRAEDLLKEDGQ